MKSKAYMGSVPLILAFLSLCGAALAIPADASPTPTSSRAEIETAVDHSCAVPSRVRADRLRILNTRIESFKTGAATIRKERSKIEDAMKAMNIGYKVSRIGRITAEAAGLYLGYGSLKTAIQAKETIKIAGQIVPLMLGQSIFWHSLVHGSFLAEGKMDREIRDRLENLVSEPMELQESLAFMTREKCEDRECAVFSTEIENLAEDLDQWHRETLAQHKANSGWGFMEFMHRNYGTQLAQIDLPWATAHGILMNARIAHLELVRNALIQDQGACLNREK